MDSLQKQMGRTVSYDNNQSNDNMDHLESDKEKFSKNDRRVIRSDLNLLFSDLNYLVSKGCLITKSKKLVISVLFCLISIIFGNYILCILS